LAFPEGQIPEVKVQELCHVHGACWIGMKPISDDVCMLRGKVIGYLYVKIFYGLVVWRQCWASMRIRAKTARAMGWWIVRGWWWRRRWRIPTSTSAAAATIAHRSHVFRRTGTTATVFIPASCMITITAISKDDVKAR